MVPSTMIRTAVVVARHAAESWLHVCGLLRVSMCCAVGELAVDEVRAMRSAEVRQVPPGLGASAWHHEHSPRNNLMLYENVVSGMH